MEHQEQRSRRHAARGTQSRNGLAVVLLLLLVGSLVAYKSAGALRQVDYARKQGAVSTRTLLVSIDGGFLPSRVVGRTLNYLDAVWPALVFGILISGAVRTLSPGAALPSFVRRGTLSRQLAAGAAGTPLMLCSCCVAPVFSSVYDQSRQLAPSLALMIAAPALNPAALLLTFLLFPAHIAWGRLGMSVVAVVGGTLLVASLTGDRRSAVTPPRRRSAADDGPWRSRATAFAVSCGAVTVQTVPIVLLGVVIAAIVADRMPFGTSFLPTSVPWAVSLTALVALPLALPTFFEIPLAATLLTAGAPAGVAAALLFVGPAVNLPSLMTVGRSAGLRTALLSAWMVWLIAVIGGVIIG